MGAYNKAIVTTAGQALFAAAIAGDKQVEFTKMETSSHAYPSSTNFQALTAIADVEQTEIITSASANSTNIINVSARFDNAGISTAYNIETLGLWAQATGGSETLVAVVTATTPDQMPVEDPDSPSAFIFNINIACTDADTLTLTVDPAGTVNAAQLADYVTILSLDTITSVSVSTSGWTGTAPNVTKTISVPGLTATSVPFITVEYPANVTAADKKLIDRAAALLTKAETGAGTLTLTAVDTPATAFTLALRGF